jgi:hypothetical protein
MNLIFLHGAPAAGKLTAAKVLISWDMPGCL